MDGTGILLAERSVSLAALQRAPGLYRSDFEKARREHGHATCCCTSPGQHLVIRQRGSRFHLACWPQEGHHHASTCTFYRPNPEWSGRGQYRRPAIEEDEDGTHLHLRDTLELRPSRARWTSPIGRDGSCSSSPATLGLTGVLHFLWESAGLNVSRPRGARWSSCHHELTTIVAATSTGQDRPLSRFLYVVPPFTPGAADPIEGGLTSFLSRLGRHGVTERRGLFLGEIKTISPTAYGHRLQLRHLRVPLFLRAETLTSLQRSFPFALSERAEACGRRIVLALVERSGRGNLQVLDGTVMLTNGQYVPSDSSFEVVMCDHLIERGRDFVKPLRYDHRHEVFPDFVLTDTDPPTAIEVWGVRGRESYELRKRAKQLQYRERGTPLIEWAVREPLPTLPVQRTSSSRGRARLR